MTPRLVGINHVALEVGDLDEALEFYGAIFDLRLRGRHDGMAFIDAGDQFIALSEGRKQAPDPDRHFGLVVDDKDAVRAALEAIGADIVPSRGLDFRDPWGNLVPRSCGRWVSTAWASRPRRSTSCGRRASRSPSAAARGDPRRAARPEAPTGAPPRPA
jgi:predicted enzyme related to lactoylglutathione lyase